MKPPAYNKLIIKVIPEKQGIVHKNYSDLIAIKGNKYYFVNLLSGKITYKTSKIKIPTGCTTIMAARAKVEEHLKMLATGQNIEKIRRDLKGVKSPLIDEIWGELLSVHEVGKDESTKKSYGVSWTHGMAFFWSGKTIREATDSNIELYKKKYLEKYPERMFERTCVHLNMLFNYALKKKYLAKLPDISVLQDLDSIIKKNLQWEKPGRVYSKDEREAMISACEAIAFSGKVGGTSMRHKAALASRAKLGVLLGLVGLRKTEVLSLRWEKIDFEKMIMNVWSFKNHKWRDVPLTDDIVDALEMQRINCGVSKLVFPMPSNPEKRISSQVFDKVWVRVKREAGIKDWDVEDRARFHDLRHTFATLTAELGWPPKVACDVLDMSMKIYDMTYAKPGTIKKSEWMAKTYMVGKK